MTLAGEADRANHVPITPDTVFGLASMNTTFAAVAIARLVEQGMTAFSESRATGRWIALPILRL